MCFSCGFNERAYKPNPAITNARHRQCCIQDIRPCRICMNPPLMVPVYVDAMVVPAHCPGKKKRCYSFTTFVKTQLNLPERREHLMTTQYLHQWQNRCKSLGGSGEMCNTYPRKVLEPNEILKKGWLRELNELYSTVCGKDTKADERECMEYRLLCCPSRYYQDAFLCQRRREREGVPLKQQCNGKIVVGERKPGQGEAIAFREGASGGHGRTSRDEPQQRLGGTKEDSAPRGIAAMGGTGGMAMGGMTMGGMAMGGVGPIASGPDKYNMAFADTGRREKGDKNVAGDADGRMYAPHEQKFAKSGYNQSNTPQAGDEHGIRNAVGKRKGPKARKSNYPRPDYDDLIRANEKQKGKKGGYAKESDPFASFLEEESHALVKAAPKSHSRKLYATPLVQLDPVGEDQASVSRAGAKAYGVTPDKVVDIMRRSKYSQATRLNVKGMLSQEWGDSAPMSNALMPVLYHEPFDPKRPWTFMNRHPAQLRPHIDANFQRGYVDRYEAGMELQMPKAAYFGQMPKDPQEANKDNAAGRVSRLHFGYSERDSRQSSQSQNERHDYGRAGKEFVSSMPHNRTPRSTGITTDFFDESGFFGKIRIQERQSMK